jgi:hypothetical protein
MIIGFQSKMRDEEHYSGDFNSEGLKHGTGTYTFGNGDTYNGEFQNDKIHGKGIYESENPVEKEGLPPLPPFIIEGNYEHGELTKGIIEYAHENYHVRAIKTSKESDIIITYKYGNGKKIVFKGNANLVFDNATGYFLSKDGLGKMTTSHTSGMKVMYEGEFHEDKKHGIGKTTYESGGKKFMYIGLYENGDKLQGDFYEIFEKEQTYTLYRGSWRNNKKHGNSSVTFYKNKDIYNGEWIDDSRTYGIMFYSKPNRKYFYQGNFAEVKGKSKKHGEGMLVYRNADYEVGYFKNGRLLNGVYKKRDAAPLVIGTGIGCNDEQINEQDKNRLIIQSTRTSVELNRSPPQLSSYHEVMNIYNNVKIDNFDVPSYFLIYINNNILIDRGGREISVSCGGKKKSKKSRKSRKVKKNQTKKKKTRKMNI